MNCRFMFLNYDISDSNHFCQHIGIQGATFDWIIQFVHLYAFEDAQDFLGLFLYSSFWLSDMVEEKYVHVYPPPLSLFFYIDEVYNFLEILGGSWACLAEITVWILLYNHDGLSGGSMK